MGKASTHPERPSNENVTNVERWATWAKIAKVRPSRNETTVVATTITMVDPRRSSWEHAMVVANMDTRWQIPSRQKENLTERKVNQRMQLEKKKRLHLTQVAQF